MTALDVRSRPAGLPPAFFAVTIFASAGLVFLVQPMVAKFALPLLGGSPSVWNTSMVFFQAALLAGYAYAHALQRVRSLRTQALIHGALLLAAVAVLPLRVNEIVGPPSSTHPNLWLLAMLTVSIGPPFAMLSATAPLVQAWHARIMHADDHGEPYVLYAASNFGSLIALLGYPLLVEPTLTLHSQSWSWSIGFGVFVLLMTGLGLLASRGGTVSQAGAPQTAHHAKASWRERLVWMALAAIPSSLMLGVTTHITTDVASAPFLWVLPLALYLVTFIIAFQAKPAIAPESTLAIQAAALLLCTVLLPLKAGVFVMQLVVHLAAFFFTALMCHQALVARRPPPERLTEFYLWMSVGGVVGGAFTALLAPVIFTNVWEYPLMLALACLARPAWSGGRVERWRWALFVLAVVTAIAAPVLDVLAYKIPALAGRYRDVTVIGLLGVAVVCGFLIRAHRQMFFGLVALLLIVAQLAGDRVDVRMSWRSFFGVVRQSETDVPRMGGAVRMLSHGTTLHGAQAQDPRWRCRPLVYYAPETPIGQVFLDVRKRKPAMDIGAVGLGTGAVSAYVRAADKLTFYEIDPQVIRISTDPKHFSYTSECAKGLVDFKLGDARLKLAQTPPSSYDVLLIDAFSSDAVPIHLLTTEAVKMYLSRLKPDGILILHLSNRNLALGEPAAGAAKAAGGYALFQHHVAAADSPILWESAEDALIVARNPQALADFAADGRWTQPPKVTGRAWSDDYSNLITPLYKRLKIRWAWLP